MKKRPKFFCMLVFMVILSGSFTQLLAQRGNLEKLAKDSELIVAGKVLEKQAEWNDDKTRIYTQVRVSVDQFLKGEQSENIITVTHLGGEIGEVGELYTGTARFEQDEEVVLFLNKDKKERFRITGGNKGKYKINRENAGGTGRLSKSIAVENFINMIKQIVKQQQVK